jgi:hypothetical protein
VSNLRAFNFPELFFASSIVERDLAILTRVCFFTFMLPPDHHLLSDPTIFAKFNLAKIPSAVLWLYPWVPNSMKRITYTWEFSAARRETDHIVLDSFYVQSDSTCLGAVGDHLKNSEVFYLVSFLKPTGSLDFMILSSLSSIILIRIPRDGRTESKLGWLQPLFEKLDPTRIFFTSDVTTDPELAHFFSKTVNKTPVFSPHELSDAYQELLRRRTYREYRHLDYDAVVRNPGPIRAFEYVSLVLGHIPAHSLHAKKIGAISTDNTSCFPAFNAKLRGQTQTVGGLWDSVLGYDGVADRDVDADDPPPVEPGTGPPPPRRSPTDSIEPKFACPKLCWRGFMTREELAVHLFVSHVEHNYTTMHGRPLKPNSVEYAVLSDPEQVAAQQSDPPAPLDWSGIRPFRRAVPQFDRDTPVKVEMIRLLFHEVCFKRADAIEERDWFLKQFHAGTTCITTFFDQQDGDVRFLLLSCLKASLIVSWAKATPAFQTFLAKLSKSEDLWADSQTIDFLRKIGFPITKVRAVQNSEQAEKFRREVVRNAPDFDTAGCGKFRTPDGCNVIPPGIGIALAFRSFSLLLFVVYPRGDPMAYATEVRLGLPFLRKKFLAPEPLDSTAREREQPLDQFWGEIARLERTACQIGLIDTTAKRCCKCGKKFESRQGLMRHIYLCRCDSALGNLFAIATAGDFDV